ncbi:MAG: diacylglycerol/polyprenol kinase family protein [Candidatus Kapaibacterium sp.]
MAKNTDIPYNHELLRKGIHLISLSIPVGYAIFDRETALYILIPLTILFLTVDISRRHNEYVARMLYKYFGNIFRPHEMTDGFVLNGASWVLLSAVMTILIFPKIIAVTAFTILIISDICAALIGRKWGRTPLFGKSVEGTMAFIISAILVIIAIGLMTAAPMSYYITGIIASIIGGIVEAGSKSLDVDDNLSIPVSVGLVMWLGGIIAASYSMSFLQVM